MNKEEFKKWFVTTPPDGTGDDICRTSPDNDGRPLYQCGAPGGLVILSGEELKGMYEARRRAWEKERDKIKPDLALYPKIIESTAIMDARPKNSPLSKPIQCTGNKFEDFKQWFKTTNPFTEDEVFAVGTDSQGVTQYLCRGPEEIGDIIITGHELDSLIREREQHFKNLMK